MANGSRYKRPNLLRTIPADGATNVALTSRIAFGFDEFIEPTSVFAGSVGCTTRVKATIDDGVRLETIANFTPKELYCPMKLYGRGLARRKKT